MTNQEIYENFKNIHGKLDKILECQNDITIVVARHDEKIKGLWKIPVISGGIIAILGIIITIISFLGH